MRALLFPLFIASTMSLFATSDTTLTRHVPKQGIVELLMEYLEIRYPSTYIHGDLLYVSVYQ